MAEGTLKQRRSLRRQPDDLILARLAADPEFDLIALAELAQNLRRLAIPVREFDELQHMRGYGEVPPARLVSTDRPAVSNSPHRTMAAHLRCFRMLSHRGVS